jgi:hypothetical protein
MTWYPQRDETPPTDLTDEEKLLAILNQSAEEAVSKVSEDSGFDEKQRATLQRIIDKAMPTPEEIARDAKINEHNQQIQQKRDEKLARRQVRQAKRGR